MNIQLKQTFNKLTTHWCQIFLLYFYDTNKKSTTLTGSNYSMIFFVFVAKTEKKVGGKFRLPFFFIWMVLARAKTQTNAWIEFFGQIDDVVIFFVLYFTTQTKKVYIDGACVVANVYQVCLTNWWHIDINFLLYFTT